MRSDLALGPSFNLELEFDLLRRVSYVTAVRLNLIMSQRPQAWLPPPS